MLDYANEAIHKEHLAAAVVDLSERVDDWKALKMDTFGTLLRFGTFQVVKGDSGKDSEREVCLSIFFCLCEDISLTLSLVSYLPVRANSSLLQRYQSQQAKDKTYDAERQVIFERERKGSSSIEGQDLHGQCHRDRLPSKAW